MAAKISDLEKVVQSQAKLMKDLEAKLAKKDNTIAKLHEKHLKPDNAMTLAYYRSIKMKEAFHESCLSEYVHEKEIEKCMHFLELVDFEWIPNKI